MEDNEEIRTWLESLLNTKIESPLSSSLTNGKILAQLTNKLQNNNTIVNDPKNIFQSMEYINKFILFCRSLEVPEENLFVSNDIKNFKIVQNCIYSFSRYAERKGLCKGIGPKTNFVNKKVMASEFSYANDGVRRQISGHYVPVYSKETFFQKPKDLSEFTRNQDIRRQIGGQYKGNDGKSVIYTEIEMNENIKNVDLQKLKDEEYERSYLSNDKNYGTKH